MATAPKRPTPTPAPQPPQDPGLQAFVNALQVQRNAALNAVAEAQADLAVMQSQLAALQVEVKALRENKELRERLEAKKLAKS